MVLEYALFFCKLFPVSCNCQQLLVNSINLSKLDSMENTDAQVYGIYYFSVKYTEDMWHESVV